MFHLGTMQTNSIRPRRTLVPERAAASNVGPAIGTKKPQDALPLTAKDSTVQSKKNPVAVVRETQEDASITPPSLSATITKTFDENFNPFDGQREPSKHVVDCKDNNPLLLSCVESQHVNAKRKVQFSTLNNVTSQSQGNILIIFLFLVSKSFVLYLFFFAAFSVTL